MFSALRASEANFIQTFEHSLKKFPYWQKSFLICLNLSEPFWTFLKKIIINFKLRHHLILLTTFVLPEEIFIFELLGSSASFLQKEEAWEITLRNLERISTVLLNKRCSIKINQECGWRDKCELLQLKMALSSGYIGEKGAMLVLELRRRPGWEYKRQPW